MKMRMCLAMVTADGSERPFPLSKPQTVIGRDTRCDLRVPVPSVSMRHCEIIIKRGIWKLNDLASVTGTFHNDIPVDQAILAPGDRITVGPVTFILRAVPDADASRATLSELKPQRNQARPADVAPFAASDGSMEPPRSDSR